jgi:fluoride ion exporter CrcB/FEX
MGVLGGFTTFSSFAMDMWYLRDMGFALWQWLALIAVYVAMALWGYRFGYGLLGIAWK